MKTSLPLAGLPRLLCMLAFAALLLPATVFTVQAQCNCNSFNLINGDFEQPPVAPGTINFFPGPAYPGWETTDPNGQMEIWGTGANGVPAQSGGAFTELNAFGFATVYQDVSTCPGQTYSWSVAHRGRGGVETAALRFGPPGGPFTTAQTMTDGNTAWVVYNGLYTVPAGQTTTRIQLVPITATNATVGNLVDNFRMIPVSTLQCPGNISVNNDPGQCSAIVNYNEPSIAQSCAACGPSTLSGYTLLGDFGGHRYFVYNSSVSWTTAQATANATGGHLATIGSAAENAFVTGALANNTLAWIGFTDQAAEGSFVWENGEPVTYTNWCPGEPNNLGGNEDYTTISWCASGIWNDLPNTSVQRFVLEFDCTGPVRTAGPASGSAFPVGTTTVSYSYTDAVGTTQTCSFTVTVKDNENPVITCPANTTAKCDGDLTPAGTGAATATDNCGVASIVPTDVVTQGNCAGNYTIARTWTATDVNGNTSSCTQTIAVIDDTPPVARCKDVNVTLANGTATVTAAMVNDGSTDNCSGVLLAMAPVAYDCSDIGNHTVTLSVSDGCGNTSTCTATVHVLGAMPSCSIVSVPSNNTYTGGNPNILYLGYGPQSTTLNATVAGGAGFSYSWSGTNTALLSCTNCEDPVFTPTAAGMYIYTLTASNSNGCSTTCIIRICVIDARDPKHGQKVVLCHIPPGNPNNAHTISVGIGAVPSHLSHGDRLGACSDVCGPTSRMIGNGSAATGASVQVYPNPNSGSFTVELPYTEAEHSLITVSDVQGKIIHRKIVGDHGGIRADVNLGDVARGVYFLEVTYGDERFRTKLVIR